MWLWLDFGKAEDQYDKFWELVAFCNIITFANSAANPICYTILNEKLSQCVQGSFVQDILQNLWEALADSKGFCADQRSYQKLHHKNKSISYYDFCPVTNKIVYAILSYS